MQRRNEAKDAGYARSLLRVGMVAGEASGDALGAALIQSLHEYIPQLEIVGLGGPAMIEAGCHSLYNIERLAVMGVLEPLLRLPDLFKLRHQLYQYFITHKPDVFIGIDAPDFNLGLELKLRQQGIPTIHYVSPSIWAWREKRVYKIQKAVDLVLTLFPFETIIYDKYRISARYVGHPLVTTIPLDIDQLAARQALQLDVRATWVAILPGSRQQEIRYMAETFLATAYRCFQAKPYLQFVAAVVNELHAAQLREICRQQFPHLPITFIVGRAREVMAAADIVLVTSGTATLEGMLLKRPMVIAYRMAAFNYQLAKWLVKTPYIGLPNILAGQRLVPEFIQHQANPESLSRALLDYLEHPQKMQELHKVFAEMHSDLRTQAQQPAQAVLELLASRERTGILSS